MEEENNTDVDLTGETEGTTDVENVADTGVKQPTFAEKLAEITGRDIPDDQTAEKVVKDTFSYVGKRQDKAEAEAFDKLDEATKKQVQDLSSSVEDLKLKNFYAENPQYKGMEKVIADMGGNPADVVEKESFKDVFAKVKGYEESKDTENVLKSNPRVTETRNTLQKANEALAKGNQLEAETKAVDAVLESLGK